MLIRLGWLLGAIFSSLLALWAALWGWAELGGDGFLERLNGRLSASPVQLETWPLEWRRIERARQFNPVSADYVYLQAEAVQLIGAEALSRAGVSSDADTLTLDLYRRALRRRPHWGSVWAQLADLQLAISGDFAQSWLYLERAKTFALYEPAVRFMELRIGLAHWPQLDAFQRDEIIETATFLLGKKARFVIDLAISTRWVEQLRPLLHEAADMAYLERRLERAEIFSLDRR